MDLERPSRFERYVDPSADVWPLVFSERELEHARGLADPKRALCAAFCVKEAFTKALRAPFEYTECELLHTPKAERHEVLLAPELRSRHGIGSCDALVRWPSEDACLVVVYVYEAT